MIIKKTLSRKLKSTIENNVRSLDETVRLGYAMLFSEALKNPFNEIACLTLTKEYIGIKFVPLCHASSFPGGIEYIEKIIAKYKNNLDQITFTWVSAYIGNKLTGQMHVLERPEVEYYLKVLEKYIDPSIDHR